VPASARADALDAIAEGVAAWAPELAALESADVGKTLRTAQSVDIPRAAANMRFFAGALRHDEGTAVAGASTLDYAVREPVGVPLPPPPLLALAVGVAAALSVAPLEAAAEALPLPERDGASGEGEHAPFHQGYECWLDAFFELDANQQSPPAHFAHLAELALVEVFHDVLPFAGGVGRQIVGNQGFEGSTASGTGQWVAAKGRAVAGWGKASQRFVDGDGPHRHTPRHRFGHNQYIRGDAVVRDRKQTAGAPKAGLDFVDQQQCPVLATNLGRRCQITGRGGAHPTLALDRLEDYGGGLVRDGGS
jgi:hypothetical protein